MIIHQNNIEFPTYSIQLVEETPELCLFFDIETTLYAKFCQVAYTRLTFWTVFHIFDHSFCLAKASFLSDFQTDFTTDQPK